MIETGKFPGEEAELRKWLDTFFKDPEVCRLLKVNRHEGTLWFHQESAQEWFNWLFSESEPGTSLSLSSLAALLPQSQFRWEKLKEKLVIFFNS